MDAPQQGGLRAGGSATGRGASGLRYGLAKMAGVLRKVAFFVMTLPYSDAFCLLAFDREFTETFCEDHLGAFELFGSVFRSLVIEIRPLPIF
jgi:hypothetical protein